MFRRTLAYRCLKANITWTKATKLLVGFYGLFNIGKYLIIIIKNTDYQ